MTHYKNECVVIPSGMDLSQFDSIISKEKAREMLDLPHNKTLFGLIGRFDPQKGQLLLLEAMEKAKDQQFEVVLLGEPTKNEGEAYFSEMQQKIEKATFEIAKPLPAVQLEITAPKKNFHIIAGAFRIPENAERIVVKLKEEGYDARILGVNKWGLSVVSFNSYLTKEESEAGLEQIQQSKEKEAWILFQEL